MPRRAGALFLLALAGAVAPSPQGARVEYWVKHQPDLVRELDAAFARISDPRSARWGRHLSHAEVQRLQAPSPSGAAAVRAQLQALGATGADWTLAGDKVVAYLPPDAELELGAEQLLPASLRDAVDMAAVSRPGGRDRLSTPRRPAATPPAGALSTAAGKNPSECLFDKAVPPCIRNAYGVNGTKATATAFNAQAVVVNQDFKPSDIAKFQKEHGLPAQKVAKTVGKKNTETAGDEATLDLEFIISMGQLVPTWWVYIDGHAENPFASWLTWAANTTQIPYVHSLSVGVPEHEVGEALIGRMNDEMKALGARGVSLFFASGDSGYVPEQKYPASSPYVTSVGGVTWGSIYKETHITVDEISTGGFSSEYKNHAPDYQKDAVQHFLTNTTGARPKGNINASRRCIPDLSAYSTGFYIVQDGSDSVIGGTSASCPVIAGMVGLINDALIAAGHTPLGFANPFFYQNMDAFEDITHGGNNGYDAVVGYDPASGIGTFGPGTFAELRSRALKAKAGAAAARAAAA